MNAAPPVVPAGMIDARDLTRRFGSFVAVAGVTLQVPPGAVLALLGPNGAGKTTIVRMLAGLVAPSSGRATVAGYDVTTDPAGVRTRVGLVTDVPGLYEQMAPGPYLDFFGRLYGLEATVRSRRIAGLLDFFGLTEQRDTRMAGFSKGMKQKVALARALLHEPPVLFLDEPTSGLDPLGARSVRDLIRNLRDDRRAVILCTHDLDEAERLADEIVILRGGRIVATGTPGAIRSGIATEVIVRIELTAPCPGGVTTLFDLTGISEITTGDGLAGPETIVSFRTSHPRETNPAVIARLVAAGAGIVSVMTTTPSLEDAYAAVVTTTNDGDQSGG